MRVIEALSQLRICRPKDFASFTKVGSKLRGLSFDSTCMKDAQCVETNEKNNFPIFTFRAIVRIHRKLNIFRTKMTITQNKIEKSEI